MSLPMAGIMNSREFATACAVAMPPEGGTSGSARPWITSVGAVTLWTPAVRPGLAEIAMI